MLRYRIKIHTNPSPVIDPRFQAIVELEDHWKIGPMRETKEEAEDDLENILMTFLSRKR